MAAAGRLVLRVRELDELHAGDGPKGGPGLVELAALAAQEAGVVVGDLQVELPGELEALVLDEVLEVLGDVEDLELVLAGDLGVVPGEGVVALRAGGHEEAGAPSLHLPDVVPREDVPHEVRLAGAEEGVAGAPLVAAEDREALAHGLHEAGDGDGRLPALVGHGAADPEDHVGGVGEGDVVGEPGGPLRVGEAVDVVRLLDVGPQLGVGGEGPEALGDGPLAGGVPEGVQVDVHGADGGAGAAGGALVEALREALVQLEARLEEAVPPGALLVAAEEVDAPAGGGGFEAEGVEGGADGVAVAALEAGVEVVVDGRDLRHGGRAAESGGPL